MKQDLYITSADTDQSLHYVIWAPAEPPVAVLQLVHGMEEYITRYEPLAQAMVSRGWAVIGHDHLGHGQSGKWERGFFTERRDGARLLIDDMHTITQVARQRWTGVPLFIFGHSMGSFFTRRYLAEYGSDVNGAIICGSGWYSVLETGTAYWAARIISRLKGMHSHDKFLTALCSLPFLHAFADEGSGAWLSRNKQNVINYKADPLCGFGFTCGAYRHMYENLKLVSQSHHYSQLVAVPLLVISGADDPVGGTKGVKRIAAQYRELGFPDVTERILQGDRHEILFEDDAADTIRFIADWLDSKFRKCETV